MSNGQSREIRRTERLRSVIRRRGIRRRWEAILAISVIAITIAIPLIVVPRIVTTWQKYRRDALVSKEVVKEQPAIIFPDQIGQPMRISESSRERISVRLATVRNSETVATLKMDGILYLDPDFYSLVRSRFEGEVVSMLSSKRDSTAPSHPIQAVANDEGRQVHSFRVGDSVEKGELLAVLWSRELGEKKSELAEVLLKLAFDRESLNRLSSNSSAVPINSIREAERRVREGEIAAERIEQTLMAWRLTSDEISNIAAELSNEQKKMNPLTGASPMNRIDLNSYVDRWARVEIRSPINGTIVEKNITEGALVTVDDTLFKIADLSHLDVRAFAYEEDLAALQRLPNDKRSWTIKVKGDSQAMPIEGSFDRIGDLIDPIQHTGVVMGWVSSNDRQLRAGQFVTATVKLVDPKPLFSVPSESLVDIDGSQFVIVQQESPDEFLPIQVDVVRSHDGVASIDDAVQNPLDEDINRRLNIGRNVITSGAVEIMAEHQLWKRHVESNNDTGVKSLTDQPADKSNWITTGVQE